MDDKRQLDEPWEFPRFEDNAYATTLDELVCTVEGSRAWAVLTNADNGLNAEVRYTIAPNGRVNVTALILSRDMEHGGPNLTSKMIKSLPIDALTSLVSDEARDTAERRARAHAEAGRHRTSPHRLTDDFLAGVAERYIELHEEGGGDAATRLAEERGAARPTVSGWLRRARDRGLLPLLPRGGRRRKEGGR